MSIKIYFAAYAAFFYFVCHALRSPYKKFHVIDSSHHMFMAFDAAGMCMLGENTGDNIPPIS